MRPFDGVNNKRSSMIASQYFLFYKKLRIALMYDCHIEGDMFNPIDIHWYRYDVLPKLRSIPQYFLEFSDNLKDWNASFKSRTDDTLHLELPNTENLSLSKGYAKLFFDILMFKCLKSVTTLLSF